MKNHFAPAAVLLLACVTASEQTERNVSVTAMPAAGYLLIEKDDSRRQPNAISYEPII
jgi:hypothetical protein